MLYVLTTITSPSSTTTTTTTTTTKRPMLLSALLHMFLHHNLLIPLPQVTIPIRIGFKDLWPEGAHKYHMLFIFFDYVGDLFFWGDIFVNFRYCKFHY